MAGQSVDGQIFIFTHEAAVFSHIGTQDGRQFTFITLGRHGFTPLKLIRKETDRLVTSKNTKASKEIQYPLEAHNGHLHESSFHDFLQKVKGWR
jgi:hypothetical protein